MFFFSLPKLTYVGDVFDVVSVIFAIFLLCFAIVIVYTSFHISFLDIKVWIIKRGVCVFGLIVLCEFDTISL